jgi:hypothetical protein
MNNNKNTMLCNSIIKNILCDRKYCNYAHSINDLDIQKCHFGDTCRNIVFKDGIYTNIPFNPYLNSNIKSKKCIRIHDYETLDNYYNRMGYNIKSQHNIRKTPSSIPSSKPLITPSSNPSSKPLITPSIEVKEIPSTSSSTSSSSIPLIKTSIDVKETTSSSSIPLITPSIEVKETTSSSSIPLITPSIEVKETHYSIPLTVGNERDKKSKYMSNSEKKYKLFSKVGHGPNTPGPHAPFKKLSKKEEKEAKKLKKKEEREAKKILKMQEREKRKKENETIEVPPELTLDTIKFLIESGRKLKIQLCA